MKKKTKISDFEDGRKKFYLDTQFLRYDQSLGNEKRNRLGSMRRSTEGNSCQRNHGTHQKVPVSPELCKNENELAKSSKNPRST